MRPEVYLIVLPIVLLLVYHTVGKWAADRPETLSEEDGGIPNSRGSSTTRGSSAPLPSSLSAHRVVRAEEGGRR